MGANFLLASIPACKLTKKRHGRLVAHVLHMTEDDFLAIDDGAWEPKELRQKLLDAISSYQKFDDNSYVAKVQFDEMTYPMYLSGGPSWGDMPTDEADEIWVLSEVEVLYNQILEWAKEDSGRGQS